MPLPSTLNWIEADYAHLIEYKENRLVGERPRCNLERVKVDLPELQAATTTEVALEKARAAFVQLQKPVVVEDAGIELDAFGGFPGPFIKFWEVLGGLESICRAVDGPGERGVVAVG